MDNYVLQVMLIVKFINWRQKSIKVIVNNNGDLPNSLPTKLLNYNEKNATALSKADELLHDMTGFYSKYKGNLIIPFNYKNIYDSEDRVLNGYRHVSLIYDCIVPEERILSNYYHWVNLEEIKCKDFILDHKQILINNSNV